LIWLSPASILFILASEVSKVIYASGAGGVNSLLPIARYLMQASEIQVNVVGEVAVDLGESVRAKMEGSVVDVLCSVVVHLARVLVVQFSEIGEGVLS